MAFALMLWVTTTMVGVNVTYLETVWEVEFVSRGGAVCHD